MVGSMLAAAVAPSGLNVVVLENKLPAAFDSESPYDLRVSALSIASENMLTATGAWQHILQMRSAAFQRMKVWDGEAGGSTTFDSTDVGHTHLGTIVENRIIQLALHRALESSPSVSIRAPSSVTDIDVASDHVRVFLDDGEVLTTKLLVGADGARSTVRQLSGIESVTKNYPQHALVASVNTRSSQQDITWQRFMPSGPQALLPLQGPRASMVWYHSSDEIERLLALDDTSFLDEMQQAFPLEDDELLSVAGRASFPLVCAHAEHYVQSRLALVGDAAHSVHPLAGQGVNMGLLDAATLADGLKRAHESGRDIGSLSVLRPYERVRRGENAAMIKILDGFYEAFKPQPAVVKTVRSGLLDSAQRLQPVRKLLMQHAMGIRGDLPDLALNSNPAANPL